MRVLYVSPHPDDECDNAGGTLASLARRHEVFIVYLTDGSAGSPYPEERGKKLAEVRKSEALAGLEVLGVNRERAFFFGYPDGNLKSFLWEASRKLLTLLDEVRPEVVIYPSVLDAHPDHWSGGYITKSALRESGLAATELSYLNWVPEPSRGLIDLIKYTMILLYPKDKVVKVDVREYKQVKLEAMRRHASQFKYLTPDYIKRFFETDYETFFIEREPHRGAVSSVFGLTRFVPRTF
ncbi:PIG-L deacetylase family protein [Stygiolobus caldivivus]|uniref:PIG-L family deacetylase n=1 Tax=Stygiolobus caldivivus TaxID=2824673 RepID=A0A8D5U652_9CREN|nr:PIG-L deacetylase family protein [Stygiolobus caldivivus]BCU70024.1 PIG-L family deacetylase [Stygiolobus caldivivus]